jgi:hypothetical protein
MAAFAQVFSEPEARELDDVSSELGVRTARVEVNVSTTAAIERRGPPDDTPPPRLCSNGH